MHKVGGLIFTRIQQTSIYMANCMVFPDFFKKNIGPPNIYSLSNLLNSKGQTNQRPIFFCKHSCLILLKACF